MFRALLPWEVKIKYVIQRPNSYGLGLYAYRYLAMPAQLHINLVSLRPLCIQPLRQPSWPLKTYVTPVFRKVYVTRALGGNVKLTFPLVFICHVQYAYTYHGANYACVLLFTYSLYWYRTSLHQGLLIHIGFSIKFTAYAILLFCVSHRTMRLKFYISFSSNVYIFMRTSLGSDYVRIPPFPKCGFVIEDYF